MDPNRARQMSPRASLGRKSGSPRAAEDESPTLGGGEGSIAVGAHTESTSHASHPLPVYQPPNEEESTFFYRGFPTQPRLLGRTSSVQQPWESIRDQMKRQRLEQAKGERRESTFFSTRSLTPGPIGHHAIRGRWNLSLFTRFAAKLKPLPWRTIDILRMISADCDTDEVDLYTGTVVVWIALQHANTPWKIVASVLGDCRRVLDAEGLYDVDIQLRMSQAVHLTGQHTTPVRSSSSTSSSASRVTPLINPFMNYVMRLMDTQCPFTTTIGQPIFPFKRPTIQGSLGLFCWPDMANSSAGARPTTIYAITCRHVGMSGQGNQILDQTKQAKYDAKGQPIHSNPDSHIIGIAAQKTADEFFEDIDQHRGTLVYEIKGVSGENKQFLEMNLSTVNRVADATLPFKDPEARRIGKVVYSPPLDKVSEPNPPMSAWTRDICLIEIDEGKVPTGAVLPSSVSIPWPANIVDLRVHKKGGDHLERLLNSFPQVPPEPRPGKPTPQPMQFKCPKDGFFRLSGVIPLAEMNCPPGPAQDKNGDYCIVVGKNGPETGLTWGWASEIKSVNRTPGDDGVDFLSWEWAIYGLGKKGPKDKETTQFSNQGDSGSAVFGIDGRLGGFLTSGTNPRLGLKTDVAYATPAVFVLKDIEKSLGRKVSF